MYISETHDLFIHTVLIKVLKASHYYNQTIQVKGLSGINSIIKCDQSTYIISKEDYIECKDEEEKYLLYGTNLLLVRMILVVLTFILNVLKILIVGVLRLKRMRTVKQEMMEKMMMKTAVSPG